MLDRNFYIVLGSIVLLYSAGTLITTLSMIRHHQTGQLGACQDTSKQHQRATDLLTKNTQTTDKAAADLLPQLTAIETKSVDTYLKVHGPIVDKDKSFLNLVLTKVSNELTVNQHGVLATATTEQSKRTYHQVYFYATDSCLLMLVPKTEESEWHYALLKYTITNGKLATTGVNFTDVFPTTDSWHNEVYSLHNRSNPTIISAFITDVTTLTYTELASSSRTSATTLTEFVSNTT
jgi:hypothetical protein